MPGVARAISDAARTSASMLRPGTGRTWMVTSRLTSDCQSLAALTTSMATPVVSEARNVMMATTAVSERPAIESLGTIGAVPGRLRTTEGGASNSSHGSAMTSTGSVVDMQATFVQD